MSLINCSCVVKFKDDYKFGFGYPKTQTSESSCNSLGILDSYN